MAKRRKLKYNGPAYSKGIRLPGTDRLIRPAEFTVKQREDFLTKHPHYAGWWVEEPGEDHQDNSDKTEIDLA